MRPRVACLWQEWRYFYQQPLAKLSMIISFESYFKSKPKEVRVPSTLGLPVSIHHRNELTNRKKVGFLILSELWYYGSLPRVMKENQNLSFRKFNVNWSASAVLHYRSQLAGKAGPRPSIHKMFLITVIEKTFRNPLIIYRTEEWKDEYVKWVLVSKNPNEMACWANKLHLCGHSKMPEVPHFEFFFAMLKFHT